MQIQKPEINCSTCQKPVALEIAKTDEVGQAVHEECYLLKLGIKRDAPSKAGIKRDDFSNIGECTFMIRLSKLKDELTFLRKLMPDLEARPDLGHLATQIKSRIDKIRQEIRVPQAMDDNQTSKPS